MTDGQKRALWQLKLIAQEDPGVFDLESVSPPTEAVPLLKVDVSLRVGGLKAEPGGARLRAREEFRLVVLPDFPFAKPEVFIDHHRFAGMPHVQWAKYLCLYQSATEWNASDGMFGLVQRLCDWLSKAAANQLDPVGQARHPPAVYANYVSGKYIVPRVDTPAFETPNWIGVAELHETPYRTDIVGWHAPENIPDNRRLALAVLFADEWPWEYPQKGAALFQEFSKQGVSQDFLLRLLAILANDGAPDAPLYMVVGTPMRGVVGGLRKQHLAVWSLDPLVKKALVATRPAPADTADRAKWREEVWELLNKHLQGADLTWCPLMEARPEVTQRRDASSPLAAMSGRSVAVWGCGALGAPIAFALCRAGVKRLVLVDTGRVSPGILVRQPYRADDVGRLKVDALEAQLKAIRPEVIIDKLPSDVSGRLAAGADWASGCDLVIDATASEVVRKRTEEAWNRSLHPRVPLASLVVDATASRLLVGFAPRDSSGASWDIYRKAKIELLRRGRRDYADAFFPSVSQVSHFQPEPGCSEPTFQGSAADSSGLAAIGLNLISDWFANPASAQHAAVFSSPRRTAGSSAPQLFEFSSDVVVSTDRHELRISPAVIKQLRGWIQQNRRQRSRRVETGGLLWGEWDDAARVAWVTDASGPPVDSEHSADLFVCGKKGTVEENLSRQKQSRNAVQYVGMWHTHPASSPIPSDVDYHGMAEILALGPTPPAKNLLFIVGRTPADDVLSAYVFLRELDHGDLRTLKCSGNFVPLRERVL